MSDARVEGQNILEALHSINFENLEAELEALPSQVLVSVDEALQWQLERSSGFIKDLYQLFNDPRKPLKPREFLYFVHSLTEDEKLEYLSHNTI